MTAQRVESLGWLVARVAILVPIAMTITGPVVRAVNLIVTIADERRRDGWQSSGGYYRGIDSQADIRLVPATFLREMMD
jgi:hypothetical protein